MYYKRHVSFFCHLFVMKGTCNVTKSIFIDGTNSEMITYVYFRCNKPIFSKQK